VEQDEYDTAAAARIEDVAACAARVDEQVRVVLRRVLAQRRSVEVAFGYVAALSPGTRARSAFPPSPAARTPGPAAMLTTTQAPATLTTLTW